MKHLLKHMGYLMVSGTIFVAAACGGPASNSGEQVGSGSDAVTADSGMAGGGYASTTPTTSAADTVVNNTNSMSTPGTQADVAFVSDALAANLAEIAAHKTAVSRAENKEVRMHAQHMLTDHNKLGDNLKAYARKKSYNIPADAPADKKAALETLNATDKGSAWDKAYVTQQVRDHQEVIAKFEAAENTVVDPELKSMIAAALPQLRAHLQMMQGVQGKL